MGLNHASNFAAFYASAVPSHVSKMTICVIVLLIGDSMAAMHPLVSRAMAMPNLGLATRPTVQKPCETKV